MATPTERRRAAILYAELRNFTRMSEVLEPSKVLELANEFFALVARAAQTWFGQVLWVQNDSLVVAFSAAGPATFASHALQAAQAVQRDFRELGERWQTEYGLPAAVSLGVHLGENVFGMAGPEGQQQYVAFGDCVSIAERLVHRARAGEIVISAQMMELLGDETAGALGAQVLPPLELARRPSIPIYGILLDDRLDFT